MSESTATSTSAAPLDALEPELEAWIRSVTGASAVRATRRAGGASREGWALDVVAADGTPRALWLRLDRGHGPQSDGAYTLRREAAVYRALAGTAVPVPPLVAVHPSRDAFITGRVDGATWFSQLRDRDAQESVARDFMGHLAALHRLDPASLSLPELGPLRTVAEHVADELDIWLGQHLERHPDPDPLVVFAGEWVRRNVPQDDAPVVLVQGDTGPGNFLYADGRVTAVLDWELAHWGDPHDDLAWICVRDLQERFGDLRVRFAEYADAVGRRVDIDRLRTFRVLAQLRCAIGTLNGLAAHDAGGETANHLIYSTLHTRVLAEALADIVGLPLDVEPVPGVADTDSTWLYDVALDELRDTIVPRSTDGFATHRAKGLARMLKHLREVDRAGALVARAAERDLAAVVGPSASLAEGHRALLARWREGALDDAAVVAYLLRREARRTQLAAPAMGALATRRYSPID